MVSLQKSNEKYESEFYDENGQNPGHECRWSISEVGLERETSTIWSKIIANYEVALKKFDYFVSVYASLLIIFVAQQPQSGLGFLIVDVPRPHIFRHTRTRQDSSERILNPSQRSLPTQHTQQTQETNMHAPSGIRTCNSINPAIAYLRHRPHGHQYKLHYIFLQYFFLFYLQS